MAVLAEEKL